jgi:hypothetical protein
MKRKKTRRGPIKSQIAVEKKTFFNEFTLCYLMIFLLNHLINSKYDKTDGKRFHRFKSKPL